MRVTPCTSVLDKVRTCSDVECPSRGESTSLVGSGCTDLDRPRLLPTQTTPALQPPVCAPHLSLIVDELGQLSAVLQHAACKTIALEPGRFHGELAKVSERQRRGEYKGIKCRPEAEWVRDLYDPIHAAAGGFPSPEACFKIVLSRYCLRTLAQPSEDRTRTDLSLRPSLVGSDALSRLSTSPVTPASRLPRFGNIEHAMLHPVACSVFSGGLLGSGAAALVKQSSLAVHLSTTRGRLHASVSSF